MHSVNLLSEWLEEARIVSSPLAITAKYQRPKVEVIYQTLVDMFGSAYFEIKGRPDKAIDKTSWIFSLLSNHTNIGCYHALYDLCQLFQYSRTIDKQIQNELENVKASPQNLRTFTFELYIYRFLDIAKISNTKKTILGNQVLDGTCEIYSDSYLFECRKVFLPRILDLDIFRRIFTDIERQLRDIKGGRGMIGMIKMIGPITGGHRANFARKVALYFERINTAKGISSIDYNHNDEYGFLKVIDYDEAGLIEIKQKKDYDILFYIIPPKVPVPNVLNYYGLRVIANFGVYRSKIYEKLGDALREKKRQHRNSEYKRKIIFIDNEIIPEFHMTLFHENNMYDVSLIREVCLKLKMEEIVCIIRRFYGNSGAAIKIDIFAPAELENAGQFLVDSINHFPWRSHNATGKANLFVTTIP